jgi:H+/gluconate symporter-like permease
MTNKTGAYIVFGSIAGIMIMIIVAYYWYYVKKSYNKIVPTKEPVFV